eukprot:s4887_g1.t1
MLSTHEDAVRRESNCLIIYKHDALDEYRVWRTQVGYLLCAEEVPLSRACGIWSLRCRCWYQKPSDSDLSEMTDMSGPKDLMCHIWHLQLIYDKRQQLGAAADNWSRQQFLEYVLRAMQDADVTAGNLEAMYKEMPDSQKGDVNLVNDNPNDRDLTQPVDEDHERIQVMKQTLFEMQAKAIKKYLKKRDGGFDSSELKELFDNAINAESRYFGYSAKDQAAYRKDTIDDLYSRARAGDKVGGKLFMKFLNEGVEEYRRALPLSNDRALQRLEVRLGGAARGDDEGWKQLPPTDGNGLIQANVRFTDDNIQLADRFMEQVPVEVRLAEAVQSPETQRLVAPPVTAVAALVRPHGIGIISDIDDTVKVTEVFHGIKAVLQNTFLKTFDDVPGMAKLYQGLEKLDASFHYVSKSPPELHAPLADFLHEKGFPVSSIHLCPLLGRNRANFKLGQVESLLSQFPDRKFILVGDSGEKDPEVYAEIMRRHPKQVLKVLIRSVAPSDTENVAKARAAFQGINVSKWQVFADPREVTLESARTFAWPKWMPWSSLSNEGVMQVPGQRKWDSMAIPLAGVVVD